MAKENISEMKREPTVWERVDQKSVIHLHNGILYSREKEGALTLHNSMDGSGEHYAK